MLAAWAQHLPISATLWHIYEGPTLVNMMVAGDLIGNRCNIITTHHWEKSFKVESGNGLTPNMNK